jgi:hypothetical protein
MISRFFTTDPAPLDVRVARVVATPWPFAAYFLIRAPQVADGVMVPWPEAVTVTLLAAVLVPIWLYWVADLVAWKRERRTAGPDALELTADLSDHGVFAGDLAALVDAEAHGRAVPSRVLFAQAAAAGAWTYTEHDDRPTEPLLLTHEFTPASGIELDWPDMTQWRPLPPFTEPEIYVPPRPGRHRKREQAHPIPPIADVPNAEAYAFLNRSRELGY